MIARETDLLRCCALLTYRPRYGSSLAPRQSRFAGQQNANSFLREPKYYRPTKAGERQLAAETEDWQRISLAIACALQAN